jgi:hypothetical protein
MGFSLLVEILNIRRSSKMNKPLHMHDPYHEIGEPIAVADDAAETEATGS